jgi:ankyrin repeat protein
VRASPGLRGRIHTLPQYFTTSQENLSRPRLVHVQAPALASMPVVDIAKIVNASTLPQLATTARPKDFQAALAQREWPEVVLVEALFRAAQAGRVGAVRLLLARGISVDVWCDGCTPLMAACEYSGSSEGAVRELLDRGASVEYVRLLDSATPLHIAIEAGEPQIVSLMLQHRSPLDGKDSEGDTPLDKAQYCSAIPHPRGHLTRQVELRREVLTLVRAATEQRWKVLARWRRVRDTVRVRPYALHWLEDYQRRGCRPGGPLASVDRTQFEAEFASLGSSVLPLPVLDAAARGALADVVAWLAEVSVPSGGVDARCHERRRMTLLMGASLGGQKAVVNYLVQEGGASLDLQDADGLTALMCAVEHGHVAVVAALLRAGANTTICDASDGETALMIASDRGDAATVHMLLRAGASPVATDWHGDSALVWAARRGHASVCKLLLSKCTGKEAKAELGDQATSALVCAAARGFVAVTEVLLAAGVRADAIDRGGVSALQAARTERHNGVLEVLERA